MFKKNHYDANLIVIGAGAAGLVSAYIAAAVKAKVILIEANEMGGDCLNTGCVPSKALIHAAKYAQQCRDGAKFGIHVGEPKTDFAAVMAHVHQAIHDIAPHDSVERYQGLGVECRQGYARITGPHSIELNGETLRARHIIVATGASPAVPPIPGIEKIGALTSENLWQLQEQPKRLLILGAGPIGCELAQAFARLGTQVCLVDQASQLLPRAASSVAKKLEHYLRIAGVELKLGMSVEQVEEGRLLGKIDGRSEVVSFDKLLVAAGRRANTKGFGLEELGVETLKDGRIKVDDFMRSTVPSILACGDVAGPYQFTHMASHQAWYASVNALFGAIKKFKVDYSTVPWVIFTDPEIAHVGAEESELKDKGVPFDLVEYDVSDLDRAIAEGAAQGLVRVLVKPGTDNILGATIVAARAGEMIGEFVLAMKYGLGLNKILGTIHPYPTWNEANKYAAGEWKRSATSPTIFKWLARFHRLRRR